MSNLDRAMDYLGKELAKLYGNKSIANTPPTNQSQQKTNPKSTYRTITSEEYKRFRDQVSSGKIVITEENTKDIVDNEITRRCVIHTFTNDKGTYKVYSVLTTDRDLNRKFTYCIETISKQKINR